MSQIGRKVTTLHICLEAYGIIQKYEILPFFILLHLGRVVLNKKPYLCNENKI